jgi:sulfur relay (sulfurtransferase) complex TusBCD TusD component (DsrE family)
MTDEGVKFTKVMKFLELLKVHGVDIAVCDHSAERLGLHDKTEGIGYGSQYNNAGMLRDSERILVF